MDLDDLPLRKDSPLTDLEKQDLSAVSVDELEVRIERLLAEIDRTRKEMGAKKASRAAADAFFKS